MWTDVYTFSLSDRAQVTIDLTSNDVDPYLVLAFGDGLLITQDNNGGSGNNARIVRELMRGRYRIEATKYYAGPGSYRLQINARTVRGGSGSPPPPQPIPQVSIDDPDFQLDLAVMYAPILVFDSREQYFPVPVKAMLDYSKLKRHRQILRDKEISKHPTAALLGRRTANVNEFLEFDKDRWDREQRDGPISYVCAISYTYACTIYARVAEITDRVVIQYWFFYVYNLGPPMSSDCESVCDFAQLHEGDWEGIQLIFSPNASLNAIEKGHEPPEDIWYAVHEDGIWRSWRSVQKGPEGKRPYVYVALGSHASYPNLPDLTDLGFFGDVNNNVGFTLADYRVSLINDRTDWVRWHGRWGRFPDRMQYLAGPWVEIFAGPFGPIMKSQWFDLPIRD